MHRPYFTIVILFVAAFAFTEGFAVIPITGPKVICQGSSAQLSAPSGMRRYLWSDGATTQGTTVWMPGRYSVVVTDSANSVDSGYIDLQLVPNPKPRIGNPIEYLCEGDEAHLEAPSYFARYLWSTGDTTSSLTVTKSGSYSLTVVDTNGCTGTSDAVQIVVVPFPAFSIIGPSSACRNSTVTYSTVNDVGVTYTWTVDGGSVIGGQGTQTVQIQWTRSGSIALRATRIRPDGGSCVFDTSMFVQVGARLRPEILYGRSSFCVGESIVLSVDPSYKFVTWNTGETTHGITVTVGGNYWVVVEDSSGCNGSSDTLPIVAYPLPDVSIAGPKILCVGQNGLLTATSSANDVVFWEWNTGEKTNTITVNQTGTYFVIGTTINACVDTSWYTVTVAGAIDVTLNDVDFGTVATGTPVTALINVDNNGAENVSVMSIASSSSLVAVSPLPPRLLSVGSGETFRLTWMPQRPGSFSATLTFYLVTANCEATMVCNVIGNAVGDPPIGTVMISVPDTVVKVGSELRMPVTISPITDVSDDFLSFDLTFDPRIFRLDTVIGADLTIISFDDISKTITARVPFRGGTVTSTIYLEGIVMLASPFNTSIHIANPVLEHTTVVFSLDHGSIQTEGCWLPARIVTLEDVTARVVISTIRGSVVYDAIHSELSDASLINIANALRIAREPLLVVLLDTNGSLIYSSLLFHE